MEAALLTPKHLEELGFEGFFSLSDPLAEPNLVPAAPGTYTILRDPRQKPMFLNKNPAGWFKKKNPTLSAAELESSWVPRAHVLYVGTTNRTLRQRVRELVWFGNGAKIGHYGGRALWQIDGIWSARIAWKSADSADAGDDKRQLLEVFEAAYGSLPFANINH